MERGKITWVNKIVITRDEVSGKPKVICEGLWSGLDRRMIGRMLLKEMRRSSNEIKQKHRRADLNEEKRKKALEKARAAKKAKKLLEEESKDGRAKRKQR